MSRADADELGPANGDRVQLKTTLASLKGECSSHRLPLATCRFTGRRAT